MVRLKKYILSLLLICASSLASAQTSLDISDYLIPSLITPYYFGPEAFPVPEVLDCLEENLRGDLYADYFRGHLTEDADQAESFAFKLRVPLWSSRINISVWGQFREWYQDTPSVRKARRVDPALPLNGVALGEGYVSTDMLVVRERTHIPGLNVRACMKTACGNGYEVARYYDSAGYFFDAYLFKNIPTSWGGFRFAAGGGFLCWQTDNGRQNDATQYGASAAVLTSVANLKVQLAGYSGWERYHDRPLALRADLDVHCFRWVNPVVHFQYGLRDYPFIQIGAGVSITFDQWAELLK